MNSKYNHFKKHTAYAQDAKVSQNFLTQRRLLQRIVGCSSITGADTVIEIGTGKGHLTEVLAEKCGLLYSVEIDRKLYNHAKEKLADRKNVRLIYGDFLKYHLPRQGKYKVFANIPYNITTQIIMKLTKAYNPPAEMWLVMEKGAAKRFMGNSCANRLSSQLQLKWNMKIVYYFRQDDFHPKPKVDSVLLYFRRKQ